MRGKPGTCHPQKDGYVRRTINGRRKLEHVWIWEKHKGPIPFGHQLHHKNGVRHDNRIENLEALKPLDHARKHAGCYKKKGRWLKPCRTCGRHLDLKKGFYGKGYTTSLVQHECKSCTILSVCINKNKKKILTAKKALKRLLTKRAEVINAKA